MSDQENGVDKREEKPEVEAGAEDDGSDTGHNEAPEAAPESKEESSSSSPKEFSAEKGLLPGYEEKVIEMLPPELFQCKKIRTLNLGNNCLQVLQSRIGELTSLAQLELRGNRLEGLPVELGECPLLRRSGIAVEEDLFNTLPTDIKEKLWRTEKDI